MAPLIEERPLQTCPRCGMVYRDYPALSRTDNKTHICPRCGTVEALQDMNDELTPQSSWPIGKRR